MSSQIAAARMSRPTMSTPARYMSAKSAFLACIDEADVREMHVDGRAGRRLLRTSSQDSGEVLVGTQVSDAPTRAG